MDTAIKPGDGPGFEHIEQAKQQKARQYPLPTGRRRYHGDAKADHLVPDDGAVIRHADGIGGALADADTDQESHHQQGDKPGCRQTTHQQVERNSGDRPHGARRFGGETGAKAHRQKVERVLQIQSFQLGLYHEQTHAK